MSARRRLQFGSATLVLALAAGVAAADRPAFAQVLSLEETRACLCKEQQIHQLRQDLDVLAAAIADTEAQLAEYDRQLAQRYRMVDTDSELSVEQYKYIWEQRWAQQARLQRDLRPAQRDTVNRLNTLVADYNATCAGRTMLKGLVEQTRPTLQCPVP